MKTGHTGIAVEELATSVPLFKKLLNSQYRKTEQAASGQIKNGFLRSGMSN